MFKFDFSRGESDGEVQTNVSQVEVVELAAIRVCDLQQQYSATASADRVMVLAVESQLRYLRAPRVPALEQDDHQGLCDIVQGKYYGGLKVWSCTADVCSFVSANRDVCHAKSVLEIGCGQGLCGIAALLCGARHVTFHDFNLEVLEICTKPNIVLNCGTTLLNSTISFCSGDWDAFAVPEDHKYDTVLGSDVTFDVESCQKVGRLLSRTLSRGGIAVLGMKEFYFGTNGGREEFESALRCSCPELRTTVHTVQCGNEMKRVVLVVH